MKIISYNIRGLERGVMLAVIRIMVKRERINILCLQETKREQVDKAVCQALWGDADVSWEMQPSCNSPGGILCIWSQKKI
ncbi:hypothetical protein JHK82_034090 [Glycine max]|uniref:Endonuclease/exonuclease/phosphatase domain-containing protein n=1 Tax=Glycine max TaxID=3847 RepID=K7LV89_SOYBN|nr:hypothetical protein JHK85_034799 [Glycine max]KAG4986469.1 hypothetical protein JHK86_034160 [Glycine max]KAG5119670.1 hypothetical protein JHK82_034090 [Glycine max]KAG5140658.1 hypothetical protein JHK84_034426 [Glycine max]KAH1143459.1 hypothetical protein GYH30_033947 [Glycine max]